MKLSFKKLAGMLLFLAGFLIIGKGLRYAIVDDTDSLSRLMFHEFYKQKDIDTLFVGSSHCLNSIDPAIMDQKLGINTFNAGTLGQKLDGSLLVIKEAANNYSIKHIYLEMFYYIGLRPRQKYQLLTTYAISDYIRPSISKYLFMLQSLNAQHYINIFFPMRSRSWETLFNFDQIQKVIANKDLDDYQQFHPIDEYTQKGFSYLTGEVKDWNYIVDKDYSLAMPWIITDDNIIEFDYWWQYLQQIIQFCQEKQIELTLFSAPMPEFTLAQFDYDVYINKLQDFLEGTNVSYWDFNLCREEYFPSDSLLYHDNHHLSAKGADLFSRLLARFINGEISPEEAFYGSYQEKLCHLEPNVFGVSYQRKNGEHGTVFYRCTIIATPTKGMEYQIAIQPYEDESFLVQDYGRNKDFLFSKNTAGMVLIRWHVEGHPEFKGERVIDLQFN